MKYFLTVMIALILLIPQQVSAVASPDFGEQIEQIDMKDFYHKAGINAFTEMVYQVAQENQLSVNEAKEAVWHQVEIRNGEYYDGILEAVNWKMVGIYAACFLGGCAAGYYLM